ncbi:malonate decarboxylase holo-[acyl-carrier-protein] synthase [Pseudomonas sp. Hp2]|uniref:malonate decarboxylase holo-[acyl-carrier-protein] synthase n=1 Tax=Pseudomonas sp. Hp2 TaxID=701189 RepID=UPI00112CD14C|nr:malonate decarboxylase holo-[acyl-carrier-protein] synthase [Pseudomonas sp. Hp2]
MPLPRHTLVWLDPHGAWQALAPGVQAELRDWFAQGRPAIVARRDEAAGDNELCLGVPLPPASGKRRLALRAQGPAVRRHTPPCALADVIAHAPGGWRGALEALAHAAAARGLAPRVFGSFAWQALTGLDYVGPGSDIDLLWAVDDARRANAVVALLQRWEAAQGRRADGELVRGDGSAANWREYASGAAQVLVKRHDGCALQPREAFFAQRSAA